MNIVADETICLVLSEVGKQFYLSEINLIELLQNGDIKTHSMFRYVLSRKFCIIMRNLGYPFLSGYVYGSTVSDSARSSSDIDLIILLDDKLNQQEIKRFARAISVFTGYIKNSYEKLIFNGNKCLGNFLDVHLVFTRDVKLRRGYGSVVNSLHIPALKVFEHI